MYSEWAEGQINKQKGILNAARADHTEAVKSRIEHVKQLGSVVDVTKTLFEVSKVCRIKLVDSKHELMIYRKPPSLRLKRTSLSNLLLLLQRQSQFSIRGSDMRVK